MAATYKQLAAQLDHDLAIVKEKVVKTKADEAAAAAAKDAKFLRDRQQPLGLATGNFRYL